MMMTDPIADMLTRIRNASMVKKAEIILPLSKLKLEIAKILAKEGWVSKIEVIPGDNETKNKSAAFDRLRVVLKYNEEREPRISSLKRISKPGARVYVGKDDLPRVLNNIGMAIISTPKGLMTNREARQSQLGGEVICEIY
ncbi:30S ribosomal protein S8 [Candidatus Falkowbacteria bacterium CG_4_10_14_0_2_um_filter_41_15]|uniref:Small ribosomal subunit protein uS8 n=4 Tax=Candidatus Falkowiibacteriota TaxID=1752728 RepID=A0A2G9ZM94_9BACT|nr:MAG: 30S ribosomal protein S8 [Candidatus Falkowbacteria bacterium CG1_02_41_21]PIP34299.1 MAG: 30S ribosomal protein S8 [Candidatus Falkowbacteria bacterium CG23_combo_of_CG06-09_8_20_14_all_41_10]PIZ10737.1 MAG: 30S ribosomal protein S8 [Candidatus Falkowbacteria bacterium CG_4_10_14_0_8_um_filter_41_36]PJA10069.1 MAG: 30S ribosomal protein S8 [Candidatus Falkowbacteria bacterium CG_4_10_14_0_2_um_filter_41_15]